MGCLLKCTVSLAEKNTDVEFIYFSNIIVMILL